MEVALNFSVLFANAIFFFFVGMFVGGSTVLVFFALLYAKGIMFLKDKKDLDKKEQ